MIDLFWNPRINQRNYRKLIEFEGWDEFARTVGPTGPCIIAACHYGNFEWFSLAAAYAGLVATIVSQEFKNPLLDPIFNRLREQSGHQFVQREGAIMRLYKTLRRGGTAAILVDLALHPRQPSVAIDCLGMKMSVTYAHAWLHRRTGLPIVPVHQVPLPGGRCRVVFHPMLEIPEGATDQEIAQLCWNQFEPVVRRDPTPWLWMYKYLALPADECNATLSVLRRYPAAFRPVADERLTVRQGGGKPTIGRWIVRSVKRTKTCAPASEWLTNEAPYALQLGKYAHHFSPGLSGSVGRRHPPRQLHHDADVDVDGRVSCDGAQAERSVQGAGQCFAFEAECLRHGRRSLPDGGGVLSRYPEQANAARHFTIYSKTSTNAPAPTDSACREIGSSRPRRVRIFPAIRRLSDGILVRICARLRLPSGICPSRIRARMAAFA